MASLVFLMALAMPVMISVSPLAKYSSRSVFTPSSAATSPAAWPPMPSQTTNNAPFFSRTFSSVGTKWVTLSWLRSRRRPTSVLPATARRSFLANNLFLAYWVVPGPPAEAWDAAYHTPARRKTQRDTARLGIQVHRSSRATPEWDTMLPTVRTHTGAWQRRPPKAQRPHAAVASSPA